MFHNFNAILLVCLFISHNIYYLFLERKQVRKEEREEKKRAEQKAEKQAGKQQKEAATSGPSNKPDAGASTSQGFAAHQDSTTTEK